MPKQSGENLHVDSLVIVIRRKRVTEHMLSLVRDASRLAQTPCLPSERLVREPFSIVTCENLLVFCVGFKHQQERNLF